MRAILFCAFLSVYVPYVYAGLGAVLSRAISKSVKHKPSSATKKIPRETAENIHDLSKKVDDFNQKKDFKDKVLDISKDVSLNGLTNVDLKSIGTCDYPDQRDSAGRRCEKRAGSVKSKGRFGSGENTITYQRQKIYKGVTFQEQKPHRVLEPESVYIDERKSAWMSGKPAWWIERQKKIRILGLLKKNNGLCFGCSKISIALGFDSCGSVDQLKKNGYLIKNCHLKLLI